MSFTSLVYIDPDHTIIRAMRADDSGVIIEQSNDAAQWAEAVGGTWGSIGDYVAPPPPPILNADIDAERDRRVVAGVVITVAGYGDVALQGAGNGGAIAACGRGWCVCDDIPRP